MKSFFLRAVAYVKAHPRIDALVLLVGLVVFAAIAFGNATRASIWFDEAFSAYLIQFSYWDILVFTAEDVHPPVYYWLLKAWSTLFGTTEFALRSLSVVFGAIAIALSFVLSRRFFGRLVAGVSLLFMVVSPALIRYSDEARMYTLATVIVLLATFVLLKAVATKRTRWWVAYGVLVALGMWTHYFTAIAWLAHWVWRALVTKRGKMTLRQWFGKYFTKGWLIAHIVAVALFLPWVPAFFVQIKSVQQGFWIGPVTLDTITNYFAHFFYYLQHSQVHSWFALPLLFIVILTIVLTRRVYRSFTAPEKRQYLLIASLAWAAPVILFILSFPPLSSVFVERYLVPSITIASIFFAVTLVVGTRTWRPVWRVVPVIVVVGMMIGGVTNVYSYGNFNKNSNTHVLTGEVVKMIQEMAPAGTPIVAESPWIFYEAIFYATDEHPVYFIGEATEYTYGSLAMLRDRDAHKIVDLEAFVREHPVIWYIGNTQEERVRPYDMSWVELQTIGSYDSITDSTVYKATEYRVNAE